MNIKKIGKKNTLLLSIVLILLILAGGTIAFFGWSSTSEDKDRIVDVTVSSGAGECVKATDNTKLLVPTSSKEKGRIITMNAKQNMAKNALISWSITVNKLSTDDTTTDGLKNESFKYELKNETTGVSYGSGNFANITDENNIIILSTTEETLDYNTNYEFVLYLWIDGVRFDNNSLDMASQTYDFNVSCSITGVENKVEAPNYLSTHISNLYTPNDTVDYNGITYNLDTVNQLIEDTDGNIRYYGTDTTYDADGTTIINELKNYVYFNCDTYPETNCEKWRIIGLFGDKVKLIRGDSIGLFPYRYDGLSINVAELINYDSNWNNATINTILNNAYFLNNNVDYYQFGINEVINSTAFFARDGIGIKEDTRELISDSVYNLGGINSPRTYANNAYESERSIEIPDFSFPTLWFGKIGLAYPSDYAFASDLNLCKNVLYEHNVSECSNWITAIFGKQVNSYFITPSNDNNYSVLVYSKNQLIGNGGIYPSYNIFPVLYLNADAIVNTVGDGSLNSPYRLVV